MMDNKKSFVLYNSFYEPLKALKNEQLGKLFRSIFNYTINGEIPQDDDILIAFMFIKSQIDIDSEKWEETKDKRSEAGRLGGIQRALNQKQTLSSKSKQCLNELSKGKQNQTNQPVNVNVDVNVNDNVNIKEKINKKKKYGSFENVKLSDEEYQKLKDKFNDYEEKIENLSQYLAMKGDKYKNHYAVILNWSRKDEKEEHTPSWFNKEPEERKLSDDEQRQLEELIRGY